MTTNHSPRFGSRRRREAAKTDDRAHKVPESEWYAKTNTQSQPQPSAAATKAKNAWGDLDGDGDIDWDDLLLGTAAIVTFIAPRLPMVAYLILVPVAAAINVQAWILAMNGLGDLAIVAGVLIWFVIQGAELEPAWPDLTLKESLSALIRLQRKPLEVPSINADLTPQATRQLKRYREREMHQSKRAEFLRLAGYGLSLTILCGGPIASSTGINWPLILLVAFSEIGVEAGLRGFCNQAQKLLTPEERAFQDSILGTASRTTFKP
jgi:hypothetical protein